MTQNPTQGNWFFPVKEAPVHATVTHDGVARNVRLLHQKALVAGDTFRNTLAGIRAVSIQPDEARRLVRTVIGWPQLPENPKDWEKCDQSEMDDDLNARLEGYFKELGGNAYAAFNTMTDIAARPPESPRFRRNRPTLERRAGAWLRDLNVAAIQPGFSIASHLDHLSKPIAAGKTMHH
jgi:hypothetical protein